MNSRVVDFHFFISLASIASLLRTTLDGADDSRNHARQDYYYYYLPAHERELKKSRNAIYPRRETSFRWLLSVLG